MCFEETSSNIFRFSKNMTNIVYLGQFNIFFRTVFVKSNCKDMITVWISSKEGLKIPRNFCLLGTTDMYMQIVAAVTLSRRALSPHCFHAAYWKILELTITNDRVLCVKCNTQKRTIYRNYVCCFSLISSSWQVWVLMCKRIEHAVFYKC